MNAGGDKADPSMITPTNGMFELGLGLGIDFIGMEVNGGVEGGVDYAYGYNEMLSMAFGGDLGMGYNGATMSGGNDMEMGMGMSDADTMWNQSQVQQT